MGMVGYGFLKRAFDIIISLLVITIFWPVFILIAFSIVLTSGGGVIFKHQRIGKEGRPFMLYKFRTMARGDENPSGSHALPCGPF